MVVEDEEFTGSYIKTKIEKMGDLVSPIVDSGEMAIKIVKKENPDLILMDIVLKGKIDGIEAASQIKKDYTIPVIYVSSIKNI